MTKRPDNDNRRPRPERRNPRTAGDPNAAITWAELTEILGPPPLGKAGTSEDPARDVYGESNPGSRKRATEDAARFRVVTGRVPTPREYDMIEQRHLGWGYE